MKSKQPKSQRQGSSDYFWTPPHALYPLLDNLPCSPFNIETIWEPACGKNHLVNALRQTQNLKTRRKFYVIASDNDPELKPEILKDFLTWEPDYFDLIITNPPFSLKFQFLERCFDLGRPFALLMPITTFDSAKRQKLFRENHMEVIFFPKRVNFYTPSGKGSGAWFQTAWFTYGLKLGRQLIFWEEWKKGREWNSDNG